MAEIRPELQARFGGDPAALEWARGHVQAQIDWLREAAGLPAAGPVFVEIATWCAAFMRDTLIGTRLGPGWFGAENAADRQKPDHDAAAEQPETAEVQLRWYNDKGAYLEGLDRAALRGPGLHALLAAWSDRPHTVSILIRPAAATDD